jgi:2-dehydrotetronate isomerase
MPKFAANISMMFTEVDFPARFERAAKAGFKAVEFLFPYDHSPNEVAGWLKENGLEMALFNMPPGDWDAGDRGMAAIPGREAEFAAGIVKALDYAKATGVPHLHAMAGMTDDPKAMATFKANLAAAAETLAAEGVGLLIEPINTRDMPGYFLNHTDTGLDIITDIGHANLKLQFDIYHRQIMDGDVVKALERAMPSVGHIQIAGIPDRHEPSDGELNYDYVFEQLDALGYAGWVGCEYRPKGRTEVGLGWLAGRL